MRKIGEIWDYLMRRKPLLIALIAAVFLGMLIFSKIFPSSTGDAKMSESSPELSYNNSLWLSIYGQGQIPSYRLEFTDNFQKASIAVSDNPLSAEAYVRIFDEKGNLIVGEYTTMRDLANETSPEASEAEAEAGTKAEAKIIDDESLDGETEDDKSAESTEPTEPITKPIQDVTYIFGDKAKQYALDLLPGYRIEIRSSNAHFYSTLTQLEATNFNPSDNTEVYVVMNSGLRKASWSEAEGQQQIYCLLKNYIVDMIEKYKSQITEEVLNNRESDLANKTKIALSYYMLRIEDQKPYASFIEHLRCGGSPVITYTGPTELEVGDEIDLHKYLEITDGEDGKISATEAKINQELDTSEAGAKEIIITVTDKDGNSTELTIIFTVTAPTIAEPLPPVTSEPLAPEEPIIPVVEPDPEPAEAPIVGIFDRPNYTTINQAPTTPNATTVTQSTPSNPTINTEPKPDPIDESPAITQTTGTQTATKPTTTNTPTADYKLPATSGPSQTTKKVTFGNLVLIGFGLITFFGLVKFIFDHYVR